MKLPAFGKSLLAARFQGGHPELIQVIYGEDWTPHRNDCPLLAVKPAQFAPGIYDWRCVAGVPVEVYDRAAEPADWERASVCFLAAEVAEWAAAVRIFFADGSHAGVAEMAYVCRSPNGQWPRWWSERLEEECGRRQETYYAELTRRIPV